MNIEDIEVGKQYYYTPYPTISPDVEIAHCVGKDSMSVILEFGPSRIHRYKENREHTIIAEYIPPVPRLKRFWDWLMNRTKPKNYWVGP